MTRDAIGWRIKLRRNDWTILENRDLRTSYRLLERRNIFDILKKDILQEYLYIYRYLVNLLMNNNAVCCICSWNNGFRVGALFVNILRAGTDFIVLSICFT